MCIKYSAKFIVYVFFFLMIRRPPRSTRTDTTLSLHDALPIFTILMVTHEQEMAAFAHTIVHFRDGMVEQEQKKGRKRSEEHTSELQSLMHSSYAVFCLKKKITYLSSKRRIVLLDARILPLLHRRL